MRSKLLTLSLILFTVIGFSQVYPDKYVVHFTDKNNSPYSIENPEEFLSQRALDRRARYNIPVDVHDIPVNPQYISAVANIGVQVLNSSKWLNSVTIYTTNPAHIQAIMALPFVLNVRANVVRPNQANTQQFDDILAPWQIPPFTLVMSSGNLKNTDNTSSINYGAGLNQIEMINGIALHDAGFTGGGMLMGILDGGFADADVNPAFDSIRNNGQIIVAKDVVDGDMNPYHSSGHGTSVLSTIAANIPGTLVGTAPHAQFMLFRTEDVATEYLIEEYNWASAAEFADSAGADVLNTSLGYTEFDDPAQNHTYADMDGNTTAITRAADIAASRGMIPVNSAGNSGGSSWNYIGAPADGDSVFSIGAVNPDGTLAYFSSRGPTSDGRLKPNVSAQGVSTALAGPGGSVSYGNGTSFSSPIIAGMTTCLWQAHPELNNFEIMQIIQQSGNYSLNPNNDYGFGIPDYALANLISGNLDVNVGQDTEIVTVFPNPFSDFINILVNSSDTQIIVAELTDITGKLVYRRSNFHQNPGLNLYEVPLPVTLNYGFYLLHLYTNQGVMSKKVMKFRQR